MKYFSLFSGVGGFEIGIENVYGTPLEGRKIRNNPNPTGHKPNGDGSVGEEQPAHASCVGFSEIDKYASAVLRYRFPNVRNYGNISSIDWNTVPDFDLLVGGSPCQSFSVAGKRAGFNGASGLFWEYLRALKEKKPANFIWENVKGVLSSNGGRDFGAILDSMAEAGYSLQWQVLNAKDFGVPQNRERVFVVGTRGERGREVFFERGENKEDTGVSTNDEHGTQSVATRHLGRNGGLIAPISSAIQVAEIPCVIDHGAVRETEDNALTIDANYYKGLDNHGARTGILTLNNPKHSNDRVYADTGISPALNTMQGGLRQPFVAKTIRTGVRSSPHGSKQNWDSYAIDGRIRRLTVTECERLMSWPDDWTKYGTKEDGTVFEQSDSQRYKMCGNGVVSKVVEEVVKGMMI